MSTRTKRICSATRWRQTVKRQSSNFHKSFHGFLGSGLSINTTCGPKLACFMIRAGQPCVADDLRNLVTTSKVCFSQFHLFRIAILLCVLERSCRSFASTRGVKSRHLTQLARWKEVQQQLGISSAPSTSATFDTQATSLLNSTIYHISETRPISCLPTIMPGSLALVLTNFLEPPVS